MRTHFLTLYQNSNKLNFVIAIDRAVGITDTYHLIPVLEINGS